MLRGTVALSPRGGLGQRIFLRAASQRVSKGA